MNSEDEFDMKAMEFYDLSIKINDPWIRNEINSKIFYSKSGKIIKHSETIANFDNDPSALSEILREIYSVEYHLTYHNSFQVPVLYFNIYKSSWSKILQ